jgi:methionyl aminopeptidase
VKYETSHYAKRADAPKVGLGIGSAKKLLNVINKNFGTLPFCRRYLDRLGQEKYLLGVSFTLYTSLGLLLTRYS